MKSEREEWLEKEIEKNDEFYWDNQDPQISDMEYDILIKELQELNPNNPLLTKVHLSVQQSSGKVKHHVAMLSLAKVYTADELLKWCAKVARNRNEVFLIQPKYDGCSANFEDGVLSTRGDGDTGENITSRIPLIRINDVDIRGEIVFRKSVFEKYKTILKKKDGTPYANPRNACAGILNKDDFPVNEKILELVPFNNETTTLDLTTLIENTDFDEYITQAQESDYPADGLVIKLADEEYKKSLGATSHHVKGEMALKFVNETAETVLLNVIWSCGKEVITPVGKVEPVEISGVTVTNVGLHNMQFIIDKNIHIGDKIIIERAGDVIPHFVKIISTNPFNIDITIETCPECGAPVVYDAPHIKCSSSNCSGGVLNKFYDSVTRIGIERLGKPTLRQIMDKLYVTDLRDLFFLKPDDFMKLPRFAEKKAENLYNEIQQPIKNGIYEWQILAAMNIPGIGKTLSKILCEAFRLVELINLCKVPSTLYILQNIEGIQEKRASDIMNGIIVNEIYINTLWDILPLKEYASVENAVDFPTVCLSGKFSKNKAFYYEELKAKYTVMEKVTKDLDILIVADSSKNSGKQKKAEKMGIKIMDIDEIMNSL